MKNNTFNLAATHAPVQAQRNLLLGSFRLDVFIRDSDRTPLYRPTLVMCMDENSRFIVQWEFNDLNKPSARFILQYALNEYQQVPAVFDCDHLLNDDEGGDVEFLRTLGVKMVRRGHDKARFTSKLESFFNKLSDFLRQPRQLWKDIIGSGNTGEKGAPFTGYEFTKLVGHFLNHYHETLHPDQRETKVRPDSINAVWLQSNTKTSNKKLLKQLKGLVARINFDLATDDVERECLRGQAVKLVTQNAIDQADIDLIVHELLMLRIVRTLKAAGGKMSPRPLLKKVEKSITGIPFDIDAVCRQSSFGLTDTLELVGGKVVTNRALPEINILFNALKIALGVDPVTGITTNPTSVALQLRKLLAFQSENCMSSPHASQCAVCTDSYTGELSRCHSGWARSYLSEHDIPPIAPLEGLRVSVALLADLSDDHPCSLDHHGNCQAHNWFDDSVACPQSRLAFLLRGVK